ncbi:MAG: TIGR00366 family protein [Rubricoccaceae bacterium]|nr:TIGR00366 family protein [Rubricoccaceae bacterium]
MLQPLRTAEASVSLTIRSAMAKETASRFKAPDTPLIIFCIIILAAILTWIVPPGAYQTGEIEVEGVGTREVVIPGTFEELPRAETAVWPRLRHSIGIVFQAPILGFIDEDAAPIIAFVIFIGGAFAVLDRTGAVRAALRRIVVASKESRVIELGLIPLFMALFSLAGAVFGMAEETIPFVLIFVPLALALGYDSLTGAAIPFLGSAAGFAAAFFNPFTVGVAQGIADVQLFSGAGFRMLLWIVTTSITTGFVMWHAHRVKKDPLKSPTHELDRKKRSKGLHLDEEETPFTARHKSALIVFFVGLVVLVWGVLPAEKGGQGWYIIEIAALFIAMGVAIGLVGGLGANQTSKSFMDGARDLVATAVIIGIARGILVVLKDGQTIDTILHGMASALEGMGSSGAAMSMFGVQTAINFFVPSGSGQAALTMPLMAPLADLVGVTRQTAVLAFQMGDGFTNMIIPTSAVLMGVLSLADIPWTKWARWIVPLQITLFALGLVVLFIAVQVGFS